MKNYFRSMLLVGAMLAVMSGCSDDDSTPAPTDQETAVPVIKEGMELTNTVMRDGVVVEEVVVKVVNMGTEDRPALFQLRKSHKINGEAVEDGLHELNAFRSMNKQELIDFIVVFSKVFGITVDPSSADPVDVEAFKNASAELFDWLRVNNVDLGLLMNLTQNDADEVSAAVEMLDARNATVKRTASVNGCNSLLLAFEDAGITPLEFANEVANQNATMDDFFARADRQGVDIPKLMVAANSRGALDVIKNVLKGIEVVSKVIIKFIEGGKPVVDLNNTYISLLNQGDTNPLHYAGGREYRSSVYSVNYCTLASAKVQFETYYGASHRDYLGLYIPRISMLVNEVVCSWGMHVTGQADFAEADNAGTEEYPVSESNCTVQLDYGDCCCYSYHAYLKFKVNAETGFAEKSWKNGK